VAGERQEILGGGEDLASIATFIDRYLTQNHRQASHNYLVARAMEAFAPPACRRLLRTIIHIAIPESS